MRAVPDLAGLAGLIGDPARARMLSAVMSGKALTATELALEGGIAPSTASAHLAKLAEARILAVEQQGRHRYYRLFDAEIATILEDLMGIAERLGPRRRTGPADPAMRLARVCYDHLAGERGVWLLQQLRASASTSEAATAATSLPPAKSSSLNSESTWRLWRARAAPSAAPASTGASAATTSAALSARPSSTASSRGAGPAASRTAGSWSSPRPANDRCGRCSGRVDHCASRVTFRLIGSSPNASQLRAINPAESR